MRSIKKKLIISRKKRSLQERLAFSRRILLILRGKKINKLIIEIIKKKIKPQNTTNLPSNQIINVCFSEFHIKIIGWERYLYFT